jgi:hypothetical protein
MNHFHNFQDSLTNAGFVHGAGTGWYAPDQAGYPHLHANLAAGANSNLSVRVTFGGGQANQILFDFLGGTLRNFNLAWLPGNTPRRAEIIAAATTLDAMLAAYGYH